MGKKILVLTSSGRKNGNTNTMAAAFIKKAMENGHEVTLYDVSHADIKPCFDCKACAKTTTADPCLQDPNFTEVAGLIKNAEAVVFVMPVYWFTMPAQMKVIFDKLWSFIMAGTDITGKEAALISACEEDSMTTFDGLTFAYERAMKYLNWRNVGEVLIPSCFELGALEKTDGIVKATALANRF